MQRSASLALIALSLGVTGCDPVNRSLNSVHQPIVQRTDYAFDVGTNSAGLNPGEDQRLSAWFDSLSLGYGDRIHVADGNVYGRAARRDAVAGIAARYGLLVDQGAPVMPGDAPPGSIRVVVSHSSADVPDCPDWRRPSQPNFDESTMSNFGCANNANLAAMVANPQDLLAGQPGTNTADARTVTKALKAYRDSIPTGTAQTQLEKTSTRTGQ